MSGSHLRSTELYSTLLYASHLFRSTEFHSPQGRTQDFLKGGGAKTNPMYSGQLGAKNQLNVSYLPRLPQSSHIAKSFKKQTSKMQTT